MGYGPLPQGVKPLLLDERDHWILSGLCNSKYLSWSQLARELSIPKSTLIYRVESLEKAGVIQGHYYVLDVKVFNDIPILIHISSKVMKGAERLALKKFCRLHPKVAWMSIFFGTESAEMLVRVQSIDEARGVMADIANYFGDIIDSVHMTSPLKFFKWSDYPFKRYATLRGS
jgi:DNA-binding Lrp family transcriptional regulator